MDKTNENRLLTKLQYNCFVDEVTLYTFAHNQISF